MPGLSTTIGGSRSAKLDRRIGSGSTIPSPEKTVVSLPSSRRRTPLTRRELGQRVDELGQPHLLGQHPAARRELAAHVDGRDAAGRYRAPAAACRRGRRRRHSPRAKHADAGRPTRASTASVPIPGRFSTTGLRVPQRLAAGEPGLHVVSRAAPAAGCSDEPGAGVGGAGVGSASPADRGPLRSAGTLETTVAVSAPHAAQASRMAARATRCLMAQLPCGHVPILAVRGNGAITRG